MIANSQAVAEGTWFWYAVIFRHGERLYSHLQLALQPLFVIETAGFMALLGKGWLASKVPALLHLDRPLPAHAWLAKSASVLRCFLHGGVFGRISLR